MAIYSHSRLETYRTCPLKYKFQYIDRLPRKKAGVEAFLGSRVHDVLEMLYRDLLNGKANTKEELLEEYNRQWEGHWDEDEIKIVRKNYTPEDYFKTGWLCIESYYDRHQPFDGDRTLGVEVRVNFTLDHDPGYRMLGFIDRLARGQDGIWEIHDYKTSSSLPTQEEIADKPQLALYQIGVQQKWPQIKDVRLVWHFLRFDTALSTTWSSERLRELKDFTRESIDRIEAASEFPPQESRLCDWCDFLDRCPVKKHPAKIRTLSPAKMKKDDGVKLVDRYTDLKNREREIRDDIDEVREQLTEYARQQDVQLVAGSEREASIRSQKKFKFPESGTEKREELESLLRRSGKWDQVSILSSQTLDRILRKEPWKGELSEKIKAFATEQEEVQVRLRKKNEEE